MRFGIKNESKARKLFFSTTRLEHASHGRFTSFVPGLIVDDKYPCLGTSPDGVFECEQCGKFLIEIKCLYKERNGYAKNGGVASDILIKTDSDLVMNPRHRYYAQVQGQMAIAGIFHCYLVLYSNRGIHETLVNFDPHFWNQAHGNLIKFYKGEYINTYIDVVINKQQTESD